MSQFQPSISASAKSETLASETNVEAVLSSLLHEIKDLKQQVATQGAEMQTLKQQIPPQSPTTPPNNQPTPTSRRKLLKKLGYGVAAIAAASATGLAQNNVEAASGDAVLAGNSNIASDTTYISQTTNATLTDKAVLWGDYNPSSKSSASPVFAAIAGTANDTTTPAVGGYFQGNRAPLFLKPMNLPTTGTHSVGEICLDNSGNLYTYQSSGWTLVSSGVPRSTYATRPTTNLVIGQKLFFTDPELNEEFFYDGTRWLSSTNYTADFRADSGTLLINSLNYFRGFARKSPLYAVHLYLRILGGAGSGSSYWSWDLDGFTITNGGSNSPKNNLGVSAPYDTRYEYTSFTTNPYTIPEVILQMTFTKNNTPADIQVFALLTYKLARAA